jgi:hypothetical protein
MCSPFGFSIQQFFICLFYCQTPFVCEFQHTPLWKYFFSKCSTPLVDMRFCKHVPNSLKNKNMERQIPYLLKKMVFLTFKTLLSPLGTRGKKVLLSTLTVMILQTVRNEFVRFGGHVDIEVSYKKL